MTFEPTIQVSVAHMLGTKPGDACPDIHCYGRITSITFNWTMDFFGGDATCSKCGECWCIAEESAEEETGEHPQPLHDEG